MAYSFLRHKAGIARFMSGRARFARFLELDDFMPMSPAGFVPVFLIPFSV
jgi:hypothetical protein